MNDTQTGVPDPFVNPDVRVWLGMAAFMGILSLVGSTVLLWYTLSRLFAKENHKPLEPVTVMFIYWIMMDLIQALATTSDLRWALQGKVSQDAYCRAESVFEQIGDSGAALCVITISLLVIVRNIRPALLTDRPRFISLVLVALITLVLFCIILLPATILKHYYGTTGIWCWIIKRDKLPQHKGLSHLGVRARLQVGTEYALMWAALGTETAVAVYLLRKLAPRREWSGVESALKGDTLKSNTALTMFWYALAYAIEIIPMSIIRMIQFGNVNIDEQWDAVALIFFGAAGFVNALLFFSTGRSFGVEDRKRPRSALPKESSDDVVGVHAGGAAPALDVRMLGEGGGTDGSGDVTLHTYEMERVGPRETN